MPSAKNIELVTELPVKSANIDLKLLEGLKSGDDRAFAQLYDLYKDKLFKIAMLYFKNTDTAKDCVQESFISLYRSRGSIRMTGSIFPYLARILTNACLQEKRSAARRDKREQGSLKKDTHSESPEEHMQATALGRELLQTLEAMPAKRKACTTLRLETDMSVSEIAQAAGVTYLAARLHIHRGMSELKSAATNFGAGEEQ